MTELTFRPALPDDLPAIVTMLADDELGARREDPSFPIDPRYQRAFAAIAADPNQLLVVATRAENVVGCLQLSFIPGLSHLGALRGQIESVRIAQSERGSGTGGLMIRFAVAECRRRGCSLVQLTTAKSRVDAQRFYARHDFVATHVGMKLDLRDNRDG
jgi:ribosomal protein S18 acetylase RimI-like enzyme